MFPKYADDERNTRSDTVLLVMVGGNKIAGIHAAHFGPGIQIRYTAADPARQIIGIVEYRNTATANRVRLSVPIPQILRPKLELGPLYWHSWCPG